MTPAFFAILIIGALIVFGIFLILGVLDKINRKWRSVMATIADLDAAVAKLDADVQTLIASPPQVDVQPQVDAVNAIDAKVLLATPPPTP